jgi:uncharacterized membrane protein
MSEMEDIKHENAELRRALANIVKNGDDYSKMLARLTLHAMPKREQSISWAVRQRDIAIADREFRLKDVTDALAHTICLIDQVAKKQTTPAKAWAYVCSHIDLTKAEPAE